MATPTLPSRGRGLRRNRRPRLRSHDGRAHRKAAASVDRARAQSHLILRRSIAELTKLQKVRFNSAHECPNRPPRNGPNNSGPWPKPISRPWSTRRSRKIPPPRPAVRFVKRPPGRGAGSRPAPRPSGRLQNELRAAAADFSQAPGRPWPGNRLWPWPGVVRRASAVCSGIC